MRRWLPLCMAAHGRGTLASWSRCAVCLVAAPPTALVTLARFVADYYQVPFGMAASLITPADAARQTPLAGHRRAGGRAHVAGIPPHHRAQRALALLFTPRNSYAINVAATDELSTTQRRLLRDWQQAGWLAPVFAQPQPSLVLPQLPEFTPAQRDAADALRARSSAFAVSLLHGVTGSRQDRGLIRYGRPVLNAGKQCCCWCRRSTSRRS